MTTYEEKVTDQKGTAEPVPEVSVVIANYNGSRALASTIPSLLTQRGVHCREIILVDNLSTDDSLEVVRSKFPSVTILSTGANNGPNQARNLGLRSASSSLVLIMDNDLILAPDYLQRMARVLVEHPDAGAVSGKICHHDQPDVVQYNGTDIHFAGEIRLNDPRARGCHTFSCISAGAMMVRKAWVEAVGWFDEDYIFGWEDGDLTFRLSLAGHPCWVDSDALAFHLSTKRGFKWIRLQTRNRWWFIRTNYHRRTYILCLPAILFFQLLGLLYLTMHGHGREFLQGTWDGWRSSKMVREKYRRVQQLRKVPDRMLLCGDRFSLPIGLEESLIGRTVGKMVNMVLSSYWFLISMFV